MEEKKLFEELSKELQCSAAGLKAVEEVESANRGGFLPNGKPQILFEGQVFYKGLSSCYGKVKAAELSKQYPSVVYPQQDRTKYYGGVREWERLTLARKIDSRLADESTSWGRFQIMGFNWNACGCSSLEEFIQIMSTSAEGQLKLFGNFLVSSGCIKPLRKKDWAKFARMYNGPAYAANHYDTKLKSAYEKWVKEGYAG